MPRDGPDVKHRINKEDWFMQYDQIAHVPYMLKKNGDATSRMTIPFPHIPGCGTQTGIVDCAEHSGVAILATLQST